MSERDDETIQPVPPDGEQGEPGFLHIEENTDAAQVTEPVPSLPGAETIPITPLSDQALERTGTVEHLAARRPASPITTDSPEMKKRLSELRTELTRVLTSLRWENQSVEDTAQAVINLLQVGLIQQWKAVLIPFLYEIDRGAALLPVWLYIIDQSDTHDLPHDANPAETRIGRARRYAILMLGNYKNMGIASEQETLRFAGGGVLGKRDFANITQLLGHLALDPDTSLYATEALVKHATVSAMQALISTLAQARGWARVDVVEGCLALKQEQFYNLILAGGLNNAPGLESYIAIPIYRTIPLERYLQNRDEQNLPLRTNAALIIAQVLQDSNNPATALMDANTLPPVFERHLPTLSQALFETARQQPTWQYILALHQFGLFMGRYWSDISRGLIKDARVIEQIYQSVPVMTELERWMDGPGRDVLLQTLAQSKDEAGVLFAAKVLGELRDPRAIAPILTRLEQSRQINDDAHARLLATLCDTLGMMGDRRGAIPMLQLVLRTIDVEGRVSKAKKRDYLAAHDPLVPGSIVYTAVLRNSAVLNESGIIEGVARATFDVDPAVRTQALEALKRLDAKGEQSQSRIAAREALSDPRESIVRLASQLVMQYRDSEAAPYLKQVKETRPELQQVAEETLRQIGY